MRRDAGDRRPLLGIPIIVKDNVNTTGMPTTAGSWALAGSTPDDAFIAARLKSAGAIILGKANLSERANFRSGPSSSGWSGIGGQTNLAHVLDRNPPAARFGSGGRGGGRSRGRGGRHGDGRLDRAPVRRQRRRRDLPTLGLWSRAGVVPISADQDTVGLDGCNVTDAAASSAPRPVSTRTTLRPRVRPATPSSTTPSSSTTRRSTAHESASGATDVRRPP